jgi:hypothetical protein
VQPTAQAVGAQKKEPAPKGRKKDRAASLLDDLARADPHVILVFRPYPFKCGNNSLNAADEDARINS